MSYNVYIPREIGAWHNIKRPSNQPQINHKTYTIMKTLTKVLAFILAALIFFSFPSPAKAAELQVTQEAICKLETVVPAVPNEVLIMLSPKRAKLLDQSYADSQIYFDLLTEVTTSPEEYCKNKKTLLDIDRIFVKVWAVFFVEKKNKENFIRIMNTEVIDKI